MAANYPLLRLNTGREYPLLMGHPWLFSGAFRKLPRDLAPGAVVDVLAADGTWIGRGHFNAAQSLAFRQLTRNRDEAIDATFYATRIERALALRALALRALLPPDVTGYRLVNSEADGLPGVIVDRYDRWLVAQISTAGVERQRDLLMRALEQAVHPEGILVRDDVRAREREGLEVGKATVVRGTVPDLLEMREGPVRYLVNPRSGQKTGFFLDQRDKRARIATLAPHGRSLLNCFSYTGGFALAALSGNPEIATVNVDSSGPALELARQNYALNGHDPDAHSFVERDVSHYLAELIGEERRFDIVVVDPPAYAKSTSQHLKERAIKGYEALNELAVQTVAPGGLLLTCSCSGGINYAEFEGAVRQALARQHRAGQLLEIFGPSIDHPTLPGFLEDRYLKVLLFRV